MAETALQQYFYPMHSGPFTAADREKMPEDGRRCELIDGALYVSPSAGRPHNDLLMRLFRQLDAVCPPNVTVDEVVRKAQVSSYDGLVLPGGVANPDFLRTQPEAVAFAKGFFDAGKPVAAICHASWTLIEADVVRGRQLTSWPSLQTDLRNAGAEWVDHEVVIDTKGGNTLVTSRKPDDLKAFNQALVEAFSS